tara:strand:- start:65 stop:1051 length:987 start_codon:yes stop_codon:yes gene_type:complete
MGIHINLDGTTTYTEDVIDEQQNLADELTGWQITYNEEMTQLRRQRDQLLLECDWTQSVDSPLDSTSKTAWATYRQKLRDLTSLANAPNHLLDSEWPIAPGKSELPEESFEFMRKNLDPVGLGTTSWVTTADTYKELNGPPVYKNTPNTRKTIIFEAPLSTISGGTVSIGDTFAYNGESSTITGVAATSITLSTGIGATISVGTIGKFIHKESEYVKQDKPIFTSSIGVGSSVVGVGGTVVVTITTANQGKEMQCNYHIDGFQYDGLILDNKQTGFITLTPNSNYVGVATLTVGLTTDTSKYYRDDGLSFIFDNLKDGGLGIFVGVTT